MLKLTTTSRRRGLYLTALLIVAALVMAACGGGNGNGAADDDGRLKVALVIPGALGDKSFFDSAHAGIIEAEKDFDIDVQIIESSYQPAEWEPALRDAAEGGYDLIITGTFQMIDHVQDLAGEYPHQSFVVFDSAPDDPADARDNVYYILYAQNEGSFLAGAFAALITAYTDLVGVNPDNTIGFIGGLDIPVINDFRVGYEQGARYVNPDIQVLTSFVEDFNDPAKAKELTLAQFDRGADIVFHAAGAAGLGALEAAADSGLYAIGVDLNQNHLHPGSVLTSMLKRVDNSLYRAISLAIEDNLPLGQVEVLGIQEAAVGLAKDEYYDQYVPTDIQQKMETIEQELVDGAVEVDSAFN